jgi:hypothetical protein
VPFPASSRSGGDRERESTAKGGKQGLRAFSVPLAAAVCVTLQVIAVLLAQLLALHCSPPVICQTACAG